MGEGHIWKRLAAHPEQIGYPVALALHHVQVGKSSGYLDLMLIPDAGCVDNGHRLVLIEAKRAKSDEASCQVIGQLLKYYVRALEIGDEGLNGLKKFAQRIRDGQKPPKKLISLKAVFGTHTLEDAYERVAKGRKLEPAEIGLIVAIDEYQPKLQRRLLYITEVLRTRHALPIRVALVSNRRVRYI